MYKLLFILFIIKLYARINIFNNDSYNQHRNMQTLMVDIYEKMNNLNRPIIDFMFERRNNTYNLRYFQEFATKRKRTLKMGLETFNYRSPQLW